MAKAFFVTGTDTEIGKTTIAAGLLHAARLDGLSTAAAKPVASGCEQTAAGLRNDDALAIAERLGVPDVRRAVRALSIGERRRVGAAAALMGQPKLVVLDEATMGLDPELRDRVLREIERVSAAGAAVLFSTHLLDEVQRIADALVVMRAGHCVSQGRLSAPRSNTDREAEIAAFVGDVYKAGA